MAVVAKFIPALNQKSSYENVDTPPSVAFYLFKRTEFNVCMKSKRALAGPDALHISAFPFVYKC